MDCHSIIDTFGIHVPTRLISEFCFQREQCIKTILQLGRYEKVFELIMRI